MGFFTKSKLTGHRRVHTKEAEQEGFHGQTFPMSGGYSKLGNITRKHHLLGNMILNFEASLFT